MESMRATTKKTFFSGVLLLSLSTILVKIIGLVYKIPMLSYLGSEGMGYFHSAYEIYALFCIIATAGLPVALSVLISEASAKGEEARVARIYRATMAIFLLIGLFGTLFMIGFAKPLCKWIRSENAYESIIAISPTVLLVCISSAIRGYFQGFQKMLPTALSQLIEAGGKLVFGLLFAHWSLDHGASTPQVAAAAGWGLTAGTALSTLYLFWEKLRHRGTGGANRACRTVEDSYQSIWKRLCRLAVPMTLGASLVSLTKLIDMAMILRRLQSIGYSETAANEAYGSYTTLALSVFALLPTILNSVFLPLVPMLSAAVASGDREKQGQMVKTCYHLTAFFALPASLGVAAFAKPILELLFSGEREAVAIAAPLLSMLGASVFLSSMISATNSILHAYQVVNRPILSMLAGAIIKVVLSYVLIGLPKVGIAGAPVSTFFCNLAVVVLNLMFTASFCGIPRLREIFVRPLLLSVFAVGTSFFLYRFLLSHIGGSAALTLGCIGMAVVIYFTVAIGSGAFGKEDLEALPMGEKLCSALTKFHLFPSRRNEKKHIDP